MENPPILVFSLESWDDLLYCTFFPRLLHFGASKVVVTLFTLDFGGGFECFISFKFQPKIAKKKSMRFIFVLHFGVKPVEIPW